MRANHLAELRRFLHHLDALGQDTVLDERTRKQQARTLLRAARADLDATGARPVDVRRLTYDWCEARLRKVTVLTLYHVLTQWLRFLKLPGEPLTRLARGEQAGLLPPDLDPQRAAHYLRALRDVFRFAFPERAIPGGLYGGRQAVIPARWVVLPADMDRLLDRLVPYLRDERQQAHTALPVSEYVIALVLLGAYAGLRFRECLALRVCDVWVLDALNLFVVGKNKSSFSLTLDPARGHIPLWVVDSLRGFWHRRLAETGVGARQPLLTGTVFSHLDGAARGEKVIAKKIRRTLRACGFSQSFHGLRRYFANRLRALGVDWHTLVGLLRHRSTLAVQKSYLHIHPWLQAEQAARLEAPLELTPTQAAAVLDCTPADVQRRTGGRESLSLEETVAWVLERLGSELV